MKTGGADGGDNNSGGILKALAEGFDAAIHPSKTGVEARRIPPEASYMFFASGDNPTNSSDPSNLPLTFKGLSNRLNPTLDGFIARYPTGRPIAVNAEDQVKFATALTPGDVERLVDMYGPAFDYPQDKFMELKEKSANFLGSPKIVLRDVYLKHVAAKLGIRNENQICTYTQYLIANRQ